MKQRIFLMVFILIVGISGLVFSREDQERLDPSAFERPRRPGAVFSHDGHNEKAGLSDNCALCHHVYENKQLVEGESSEDKACSDCHGLKSGPENGIPLVRAFHARCRECHFDSGKGPVLCGQCHMKE
ncbi:MAG: cytochrome c3 family protein [Desulfobacteraceae bacterium]|nr:cytochrome c3 family protein [Desulfobacteraceae bacterium]